MSEMETNGDVETKEFTDELSDEALDRAETKICIMSSNAGVCSCKAPETSH